MKLPHLLLACVALFALRTNGAAQDVPPPAAAPTVEAAARLDWSAWRQEEIGLGVRFGAKRFPALWGQPQSVQILELDPRQKGLTVRVAAPGGFFRTSELARERGAIAAVNGGFFSRQAEAVGLLRVDGKQLFAPDPSMRGALLIDAKGKVRIGEGENADFADARDALAAGPVLVRGGQAELGTEIAHFEERHPRTAVGITKSGTVYFVTVDGRAAGQAAGMTCGELARVFVELGCETALNMDGGGSTTMWVRGAGASGVVNHPSDNGRFDAEGERRVANCVLIHGKDVIVLEEDAVTPQPTTEGPLAAMQRREAEDASGGSWLFVPGRITVGIDCELDFAGSWELWARLPAAAGIPELRWNPAMLETRELPRTLRPNGRWQHLGNVLVQEPGTLRVHFAGKRDFGVDALRLVQR